MSFGLDLGALSTGVSEFDVFKSAAEKCTKGAKENI